MLMKLTTGPSADLEVNPAGPDKARGRNDNREWDAETAVEIGEYYSYIVVRFDYLLKHSKTILGKI